MRATLAQGSAPVTAPYVAAERARFQKTAWRRPSRRSPARATPSRSSWTLPADNAVTLDAGDPDTHQALEHLLEQLEGLHDIPDEIALSIGGKKLASGKLSGTTGYLNWRYDKAPAPTKAKFQMRKMGMVADTLAISVATPFAQSIAQVPLSMTRAAVNRGNAMSVNVRDQLTRLAGQPTDSQRATEQPTPVQHQTRHTTCADRCAAGLPAQRRVACASPAGAAPARADPGARRIRAARDPTRAERDSDAGRRGAGGGVRRAHVRRLPAKAGGHHTCRSGGTATRHAGRRPTGRRTNQWFNTHGIEAVPNSGATAWTA